ncbi:hypothetical protein B0H16DRAFT_1731844 [Mycena metata]|uniref:Uncharacterized protein n=1 Tax=Mycena metata TaxID=1033252 RepID=A0AAD7I3D0_9AGAR|nr:hypothetical protein B0H16DRAFT_1731844 [Mycena metata]
MVIVTGGSTGIEYKTLKQLLLKNAKVYLAAGSPEAATAGIKKLEEETKKPAIFLQLNLADLPAVHWAAEESKLDILFNNGDLPSEPSHCAEP